MHLCVNYVNSLLACCEGVPEPIAEEEEDPALQLEATEKIIKKKQPSKKVKSKTGEPIFAFSFFFFSLYLLMDKI